MTDRDALLAAIVANPDDTTARLVFADWLDETGVERDAAHAELIRVQCELSSQRRGEIAASEDNDRVQDALESRERELLVANVELARPIAELFLGGKPRRVDYGLSGCVNRMASRTILGENIRWWWRNGFIENVWMPFSLFFDRDCIECHGLTGNWNEESGELAASCVWCKGTGRTDGIAAALFSRCPIWRVEFTDREPMSRDLPNEWAWCRQDGRQLVGRFQLPKALWDYLDGGYVWNDVFRVYASSQIAHAALSRAAIAYARKRAGLPEWVPQTEGE